MYTWDSSENIGGTKAFFDKLDGPGVSPSAEANLGKFTALVNAGAQQSVERGGR